MFIFDKNICCKQIILNPIVNCPALAMKLAKLQFMLILVLEKTTVTLQTTTKLRAMTEMKPRPFYIGYKQDFVVMYSSVPVVHTQLQAGTRSVVLQITRKVIKVCNKITIDRLVTPGLKTGKCGWMCFKSKRDYDPSHSFDFTPNQLFCLVRLQILEYFPSCFIVFKDIYPEYLDSF